MRESTTELHHPKLRLGVLLGITAMSSLLGENAQSLSLPIWLGPGICLAALIGVLFACWQRVATRARLIMVLVSALASFSFVGSLLEI